MKLFSPEKDLKSYIFPVIKIIISLIIIFLAINSNRICSLFNINSKIFIVFIKTLTFVLGLTSIWIVYMAIVEIYYVFDNRQNIKEQQNYDLLKSRTCSLSEIVTLLKKNDIIEIKVKADKGIIKIGSSSDCKAGTDYFFDKRFYIEKDEYQEIDRFIAHLKKIIKEEVIDILSIDDIKIVENVKNNK